MNGFRKPLTIHTLEWPAGHSLHGLVVKMESVTVDEYNEIMDLLLTERPTGQESLDANSTYLAKFCSHMRSWNMTEDNGDPVPPTREGIGTVDQSVVGQIIAAWQGALVTVPTPPERPSPNGSSRANSEESALGLANLSTSQGN